MEFYPKDLNSQIDSKTKKTPFILPKFCVGYKFNIVKPDKPSEDHLPSG